jgi:hypothetical protein
VVGVVQVDPGEDVVVSGEVLVPEIRNLGLGKVMIRATLWQPKKSKEKNKGCKRNFKESKRRRKPWER